MTVSVEIAMAAGTGVGSGGLFRLTPLFEFPSVKCAFRENGRRNISAVVSEDALHLCLLHGDAVKAAKSLPWDSRAYPVLDLCLDPSGSWLLVLSPSALTIVPARASLEPESKHDLKWPTDQFTKIPLDPKIGCGATAVAWWQSEASEPTAIVGDQTGGLTFISLESGKVVRKSFIVGKVFKLAIYIDDGSDSVILLITSSKNRQWNLTLEKRFKKNNQSSDKKKLVKGKEPNKKTFDEFLATLKTSFWPESGFQKRSQSTSNVPDKLSSQSNNTNPVPISFTSPDEDVSKLPQIDEFDVRSNMAKWVVDSQSSSGRHFVSIFNSNHNSFTLHHSIEDRDPVYTFKFKSLPVKIVKILWHEKIIYVFGGNSVEVHSSHMCSQEDDSHTAIWEDFLEDDELILDAWNINQSNPPAQSSSAWVSTSNISELNIPRFNLGASILITNKKAYLLSTNGDPSEWIVDQLIKGRGGMERIASALKIHLQPLLIAAADVMLSRNLILESLSMYNLGKLPPDDILCRLGALGLFREIIACGYEPCRPYSANVCVLNHIMHTIKSNQHLPVLLTFLQKNNEYEMFPSLKILADLGMWEAIETITLKNGDFWISFQNLITQRSYSPCRGFFSILLNKHYTPFLVSEEALPLLKYIEQYSEKFDTTLLKMLCIWMCPLQDCFRILYRAFCTGKFNFHLSGMRRLVKTFFAVISTLHSRTFTPAHDSPLICNSACKSPITNQPFTDPDAFYEQENYPCVVSCGHNRWGIANSGNIKLSVNGIHPSFIDLDMNLIGRAISVSCGREHVLILTENGLYSFGNNKYGQLGVGREISNISVIPILIGIMGKENFDGNFAWHTEKIVQIATGQYHSACVTDCGNLYTWGWGIHGQLAHGSIFNEFIPKRVTRLGNEKVKIVGCGSCHTAILTQTGSVYLCGNGSFGQIGNAGKQKSNIPLKIDIGLSPAVNIAVGYFHTLVLLKNNELWTWGSSPQKIRLGARSAKRKASAMPTESQDDSSLPTASSPIVDDDNHLYPTRVDTSNVKGKIIKMAGGWLHSCLIDNFGNLYVWGLNLDCQLGTGNRNEVFIPTQVNFDVNSKTETPSKNKHPENELPVVGCGGDFTVFVNVDGKVYVAGNTCVEENAGSKGKLYFVKFKNTTRKIRLPPPLHVNQFKHITDVAVNNLSNKKQNGLTFSWPQNPISNLEVFQDPIWGYKVLMTLHEHICDDTPLADNYLRALFASLRGDYAEALNLHLNSVVASSQEIKVSTFLQHTENEMVIEGSNDENHENNIKLSRNIVEILQERIKKMSMNYTDGYNESSTFECQCDENIYIPHNDCAVDIPSNNIGTNAIHIAKSILNFLPHDKNIWTECVNEATTFWINHGLNMNDLEEILLERTKNGYSVEMASAILCSREKIDYQKNLSTNFNLELCDNILQSW